MDNLEAKLKAENLRLTSARKIIFQVLQNSSKALTAQEVCNKLQDHKEYKADQASVYRNLNLFSKIGLTHQLHSGKYTACHHPEESHNHGLHILVNCRFCGSSYEVKKDNPNLKKTASKLSKLIDDLEAVSSLSLQGTCKNCMLDRQ